MYRGGKSGFWSKGNRRVEMRWLMYSETFDGFRRWLSKRDWAVAMDLLSSQLGTDSGCFEYLGPMPVLVLILMIVKIHRQLRRR